MTREHLLKWQGYEKLWRHELNSAPPIHHNNNYYYYYNSIFVFDEAAKLWPRVLSYTELLKSGPPDCSRLRTYNVVETVHVLSVTHIMSYHAYYKYSLFSKNSCTGIRFQKVVNICNVMLWLVHKPPKARPNPCFFPHLG